MNTNIDQNRKFCQLRHSISLGHNFDLKSPNFRQKTKFKKKGVILEMIIIINNQSSIKGHWCFSKIFLTNIIFRKYLYFLYLFNLISKIICKHCIFYKIFRFLFSLLFFYKATNFPLVRQNLSPNVQRIYKDMIV